MRTLTSMNTKAIRKIDQYHRNNAEQQLRNADSRKNSLSQGRAHQLVLQDQRVIHECTHTINTN